MSKKLNNLKWQSVALEGFPASMSDKFQGFVGLEECTNYGLDKEAKSRKKQNQKRKREESVSTVIPTKKVKQSQKKEINNKSKIVKLINGFIVESCEVAKPSTTNEIVQEKEKSKKRKNKKKKKKLPENNEEKPEKVTNKSQKKNNSNNKTKPKLGENKSETASNLTPEDMLTWAEFKLPEPIMKALTELGFKKPTKIQELSLPAAIHGRRDILGAAETGSGKTLAFGLPILTGILKLKEKAEMGLDVYELPYKKTSIKRKNKEPEPVKKGKTNKKSEVKGKKKPEQIAKESSEDGYGTDDEENSETDKTSSKSAKVVQNSLASESKAKSNIKTKSIKANNVKKANKSDDDDFLEEIVVPIKKRNTSADEGNDSDDSANYIHLSEMLDSDDLADSSDNENVEKSVTDDNSDSDTKSADGSNDENDGNQNEVSEGSELDDSSVDETQLEVNEGSEIDDSSDEDDETQLEVNEGSEIDDSSDEDDESQLEVNEGSEVDDSDEYDDIQNEGSEVDEDVKQNEPDNDEENSDKESIASENENGDIYENEEGIGCVKVIDNVEIPGHVVVKTGKPLYALILTPTRELAIQISRHLIAVAKYTGIKVATIVGGMAAVKQERVLRSGPEVVVATPGRLWELITQGQPHLQQLDCVKFLAIDETDRMIERGHFEELHPLLERLNADEARSSTRQNFVFSATLTMVHDLPAHMRGKKVTKRGKIINRKIEKMTPQQKIKKLVAMIGMTEPKVVDITTQNLGTAETLTESRISCAYEHKDAYLYYILKRHPGRTIVFCNSINSVKRLAELLTLLKCRPLPLHASMPQRQRLKNLERFRDDPHGVLIATDVAARGLDIPDVDHVIHYQVPKTAENYVHRSGRTARANKEGLTILMMEPAEAYLYAKLCRTLNKTSEVPSFPVPPAQLSPLKALVSAARELEALALRRRRAAHAQGWRDRAAREMDMIIDDDDLPVKQIDPSIDKALQAKKRQLESMLTRPLFPKGFSYKYPTLNDPAMFVQTEENALQVMKKSLESGELKKEKRKSKNASLLKLQKQKKK